MEKVSVGEVTRKLFGMLGSLHDFIDTYCEWHANAYPGLSRGGEVDIHTYEEICNAIQPAISFIEAKVIERVRDYMDMTAPESI